MPTVDELLNVEPFAETGDAHEQEIYCVIHPDSRTIEVPEEYQLLGVVGDKKVERLWFQCPKVVGDNKDISDGFVLFINYRNANGDPDAYRIKDMEVEGENITFSWELEEKVTAYQGTVDFSFRAIKPETESENKWNTTINSDCSVLVGLQANEQITKDEPDALAQIWDAIDELKAGGGGGGTPGKDGREIEIQNNGTAIQWRYVGDESWTDLVQLSEITGPKGDPGEDGVTPTIGENGNWYLGDEDTGKPSRGSDVSLVYSQIEKISKKIFSGEIKKIILIGDSITDGYGGTGYNGNRTYGYLNTAGYCWANILKKYLSDRFQIETDNYGKYNSKIDEQFQIIQSNIISGNYDLCVWLSGTNNRVDSSTFQSYKTILPQAINYLKDNIDDFVIISAIPATKDDEAGRGHKGYEIDEVALSSCVSENCCFSSGYRKFCDYIELTKTDIASCFSDHVHPNDLGYYILFKIICNILNIPLDPYTNYKIDGGYWDTEDPGGSEDGDNVIIDTYNKGGQLFVAWGDGVIPVILTAGYNADNHSTIYSDKTIKTIKFNLGESGNSGTITIGKLDLTLPRSQADTNIVEETQYTIDSDGLVDLGDGITLGNTETLTIGREADTARLIYYTNATSDDNIMTCRIYAVESNQISNSTTGIPIIVTI